MPMLLLLRGQAPQFYDLAGTEVTSTTDSAVATVTPGRTAAEVASFNRAGANANLEGTITGWTVSNATRVTYGATPTAHSETQGVRVQQSTPGFNDYIRRNLGNALVPGQQYTISAWAHLDVFNPSSPAVADYGLYVANGIGGDNWSLFSTNQVGQWTLHAVTVTANINVVTVYLCTRGDVTWDEIYISAVDGDEAATARVPVQARSTAETTSVSDTASATVVHGTLSRTGTDIATASDVLVRRTVSTRTQSEILPNPIDTATRGQLGAVRTWAETATAGDSTARKTLLVKSPSELLIIPVEVLSSVGKHFRSMAETPTQAVTDNFGRSGGLFNRNPNDLAGAADTQLGTGQTLFRIDNVESIPTTEALASPSTHVRTNFPGDSAPAVDSPLSYGGNVRFGFDGAGGRADAVDSFRIARTTASITRVLDATFTPRTATPVVWHRSATDSAPFSSDAASRPPFQRVRTTVDNIPLQGESNVKPVYHSFVLSGDEEILFRGDVLNVQFRLARIASDPIAIGLEAATWQRVRLASTTLIQTADASFVQPRVAQQKRTATEDLRPSFGENPARKKIARRTTVEFAAQSVSVMGRTTLVGRPVQPTFSAVQFPGISDFLSYQVRPGRLGTETVSAPADAITQRKLVGTRAVNDFVTGQADAATRIIPPLIRSAADSYPASDVVTGLRSKGASATDSIPLVDGYNVFARHPRTTAETLPSTFDQNASQRRLTRGGAEPLVTSEFLSRALRYSRTAIDVTALTETARINRISRSVTDTLPLSDAAVASSAHLQSVSATDLVINGSDAVASSVRAVRSFIESAASSDGGAIRSDRLTRTFFESVAVTGDAATRPPLVLARTGFDIGLGSTAESAIRVYRPTRALNDSAPYSGDSNAVLTRHFRAWTETAFQGETASLSTHSFGRTGVDAALAFDLPGTRAAIVARAIVEILTTSDTPFGIKGPYRALIDGAPAVDAAGRLRQTATDAADDVSMGAEAVFTQRRVPRFVFEVLGIAAPSLDGGAAGTSYTGPSVDGGSASTTGTDPVDNGQAGTQFVVPTTQDSVSRKILFLRTPADVVFGSDLSQRPGQVYFRSAGPDLAPASELSASRSHRLPRDGIDSLGLSDTVNRAPFNKIRSATDSVPLTEVPQRGKLVTARNISDAVPKPTDLGGRQLDQFFRTGSETIPTVSEGDIPPGHRAVASLTDTVTGIATLTRLVRAFRSGNETLLAAFDVPANPQFLTRVLVDSLPAASEIESEIYLPRRTLTEGIPTTETMLRSGGRFTRLPLESLLGLSDVVAFGRTSGRTATDTVPAGTQAATRLIGLGRLLAEFLATPNDAAQVQSPRNRGLLESAPAADILSRTQGVFRLAVDSVTGSDGVGQTSQGVSRFAAEIAWNPRRQAKILIISRGSSTPSGQLASKLPSVFGYASVTVNATASTLADLVGYDIIVADDYVWNVGHENPSAPALLKQAYAAGYKIFTSSNDASVANLPQATGSVAKGTDLSYSVYPTGGQWPAQGWSPVLNFSTDTGVLITGLRAGAVPVAVMPYNAVTGYLGFLEENPSGNGGRWFHLSISSGDIGTRPDMITLFQRGFDWVAGVPPETTFSNTVQNRFPIEIAPAADSPFRLQFLTRLGQEDVGVSEQADRSGLFSTFLTDTISIGDVGGRRILYARSAADVASSAEALTSFRLFRRFFLDAAQVSETSTLRLALRRTGTDSVQISDLARTLLNRIRRLTEALALTDQVRPVRGHSSIASDTAALFESVVRKTFKIRLGSDALGSVLFPFGVDEVRRHLVATRTPAESTSLIEQARRARTFAFSTADLAAVSDSFIRKASKVRYGADLSSASATGSRNFQGGRNGQESLAVWEMTRSDPGRVRISIEGLDFSEVLDAAKVRPPKPFGPPLVSITSVSRGKLGRQQGRNFTVVTFEFDRSVDAWVVRVGSTNAFDGDLAVSWYGGETFLGLATIDALQLKPGENEIAIYGRSAASGEWTRPTVPDLASV